MNRTMFDPILPAGDPFIILSPQKYAKERITNTNVNFRNFNYKANFDLDSKNNQAVFTEVFKDDKSGNVRRNEHTFYMATQSEILAEARSAGFILTEKIDMLKAQYEYQYLYVLQKPE